MSIDSNRIVKNSFFLYGRMILVLVVSFYTARIVLEVLGINDYGVYFAVFSIIGILSFLNGALSGSTSRFITYELGSKNINRLRTTFSTCFITHLILGGIIVLVAETIGLWYAQKVLVVEPNQHYSAMVVYQLSIIITFLTILQVPFSAQIIAHEKMGIFAFFGIFEAVSKLAIVFILKYSSANKMILYGVLQLCVTCTLFGFYVIFNLINYKETRTFRIFDKVIFKSMIKFSGWNVLANLSNALMNQGVIMLLNLFFVPAIVAAQNIANQIATAASQFVNNIRQAINPQIIKLYAENKQEESEILTLKSSEYLLYLLMLIGVPCILAMPRILSIWLEEVPEMAVAFCRLMILQVILDNFNAAFYVPMLAANKISKNSILGGIICIFQFFVTWLLFHFNFGPLWARYMGIFSILMLSFIIKPYILIHDINYPFNKIISCIKHSIAVMFTVSLLNFILYLLIPQDTFVKSLIIVVVSVVLILLISYLYIGRTARRYFHQFIFDRISRLKPFKA